MTESMKVKYIGLSDMGQRVADWLQMRQIRDFLRSDFTTFWLCWSEKCPWFVLFRATLPTFGTNLSSLLNRILTCISTGYFLLDTHFNWILKLNWIFIKLTNIFFWECIIERSFICFLLSVALLFLFQKLFYLLNHELLN